MNTSNINLMSYLKTWLKIPTWRLQYSFHLVRITYLRKINVLCPHLCCNTIVCMYKFECGYLCLAPLYYVKTIKLIYTCVALIHFWLILLIQRTDCEFFLGWTVSYLSYNGLLWFAIQIGFSRFRKAGR